MSDITGEVQKKMLQNMNRSAELMGMKHTTETLGEERLQSINSFQMQEGQQLTEEDRKNLEIRDTLVEQMMMVSDLEKASLREKYPNLVAEMEARKTALMDTAEMKGAKKIKNDFFGKKRSKARKKLKDLAKAGETWQKDKEAETGEEGTLEKRVRIQRFNQKKKVGEGDNSTGFFARFINGQFNGTQEHLRKTINNAPYEDKPSDDIFSYYEKTGERVELKGPAGSTLKGYEFKPPKERETGKVMILYSGSGDSGLMEEGMGTNIIKYLNAGFRVFQIDYRGYGDSGTTDENGKLKDEILTERKFYEDGFAILEGVKAQTGASYNDIVLHGFSMGGAIASHVAAKLAEKKAKQRAEGDPDGNDTLGGLVMDSAMHSLKFAATGESGKLAGWISEKAAGKYSAEEHLKVLSGFEPDIPIMFVSGDKTAQYSDGSLNPDGLTLEDTKLDTIEGFTNKSSYTKPGSSHMDCHLDPLTMKNFIDNQMKKEKHYE